MANTEFSISWQVYQKNICNGLSFLQQRGELVDMTLAADGHLVKVHQVVMSLVSPFIKELITSANCPHPIIFMNKVSYQTLQLILEYAYTGEVLVAQDCLDEFLEACSALNIKGLENMGKPVYTSGDIEGSIQITINQPEENNDAAMDFLSTQSRKQLPQIDMNPEFKTNDDDGAQMEMDDDDDVFPEENRDQSSKETDLKEVLGGNTMQYTLSAQGNIQLILNRYIYTLRNIRKDNCRWWRCFHSKKACQALVRTIGDKVVERVGIHNHPFHDMQILKRVRKNNVFKVEPKKHHAEVKKLCENADRVLKKSKELTSTVKVKKSSL